MIPPGASGAVVVSPDTHKALTIRQWFLSKWYGHGGLSVRVDAVIALSTPGALQQYVERQSIIQAGTAGWCNERRVFLQRYPVMSCRFFVEGGRVDMCPSGCEVCGIAQMGARFMSESLGQPITMVNEPIVPPSASATPPAADAHQLVSAPRSRSGTRRVAFVCRALLGKVGWCRDSLTARGGGATRIGKRDSWVVEADGQDQTVLVASGADYVLVTHAIVFTVA